MKRTAYMQALWTATMPLVAFEAISGGGFDGAWQRLIAEKLRKDYLANHSEAREIVDSIYSGDNFTLKEAYLKAAYLITSSTIQNHEQTT